MSEFSGKTILVTGASGLIGSHIVNKLIELGDVRIIALSRNKSKLEDAFESHLNSRNLLCIAQDISDLNLPNNMNIDYIFNAAGPMESKVIENAPVSVIDANLLGTINCLKLLHKQEMRTGNRGRLVIFSSVTVYGNIGQNDRCVSETDTDITGRIDIPNAVYAQSKRMSEVIGTAYCRQYGVDVVIARFSTVYGNTKCKPDTAFYEFIDRAQSGENIIIKSTAIARRDNIYIDDAVSAVLLVAQKGIQGEAYNISSNGEKGNFASIDEIACIIAQVANREYSKNIRVICAQKDSQQRKPGIILDNSKLHSLGWNLETDLYEGIQKTMREND